MTANKNANTILPLLDLKNAVAIASTLYGMSNSEGLDGFLQYIMALHYPQGEYSPESIHFACVLLANKYMLGNKKRKSEVVRICPEAAGYISDIPISFMVDENMEETAAHVINCMNLYTAILIYFDDWNEDQACRKTADIVDALGSTGSDGCLQINMSQEAIADEIGNAIHQEISNIIANKKATYSEIVSYFPEAEKYI